MWHWHGEGDPLVRVDPVDTVAHHRWPDDTVVQATVEQTAVAKTAMAKTSNTTEADAAVAKTAVTSTGAVATLLGLLLHTLSHTESLIELVGPHLQFFLILNTLPVERSVLKEIVLIALLQNKSWNKYLMLRVAGKYPDSGRRYLLPLDGAAHLK